MVKIIRFTFINLFEVFLIVVLFGCTGKQEITTVKPDWYIPEDFGDQYYNETKRIINAMWDNEKNHLNEMTTRIAEKILSGGTVIWDANASHFRDTDPSFPCLPKINAMLSSAEFSRGNKENIKKLKAGDILVTTFINEQSFDAHERGVHVIGITNSYFRCSKFSDEDNRDHKPNYKELLLDDISVEIFDTHVSGQIGLVKIPWITDRKVGPGIGTSMGLLYWLTVCEVANKTANGSNAVPLEYASKYIEILFDRIDSIYTGQHEAIWSAAAQVAEKIGSGSHFWLESEPGGVRSSGTGMSMGLRLTNFWRDVGKQAGDIIFLADVTNDPDSKMVQEAKAAKDKGLFIVAIGPSTQHTLKEIADVYIDNLSPEGYGLLEIKGHDNKIAMVGSLINNIIYNTFSMQMVYEMCRRGWYPQYYSSYMWVNSNPYHQWQTSVVQNVGY